MAKIIFLQLTQLKVTNFLNKKKEKQPYAADHMGIFMRMASNGPDGVILLKLNISYQTPHHI